MATTQTTDEAALASEDAALVVGVFVSGETYPHPPPPASSRRLRRVGTGWVSYPLGRALHGVRPGVRRFQSRERRAGRRVESGYQVTTLDIQLYEYARRRAPAVRGAWRAAAGWPARAPCRKFVRGGVSCRAWLPTAQLAPIQLGRCCVLRAARLLSPLSHSHELRSS